MHFRVRERDSGDELQGAFAKHLIKKYFGAEDLESSEIQQFLVFEFPGRETNGKHQTWRAPQPHISHIAYNLGKLRISGKKYGAHRPQALDSHIEYFMNSPLSASLLLQSLKFAPFTLPLHSLSIPMEKSKNLFGLFPIQGECSV